MILRIIDKETNIFLRDDFTFDDETEIGLDVTPSQGLYLPKWNGEKWIEALSEEEITALKAESAKNETVTLEETMDVLFGGSL